jgi:hypothetical protein
MTQRRYGDEEVREIFSLAATRGTSDQSLPSESGGLTLEELQRIGQQAGIEPARVVQAAETLDARGKPVAVRRSFGLPIAVSRVVDLPRAPTDREWERLISKFRTTFGTQGRVTTSGGLREWSHGNLHISVEPTEHGQQLRLSDLKDDAVALNGLGFGLVAMAAIVGTVIAAAGEPRKALLAAGVFGGLALLAFVAANMIRTPLWARERAGQMEAMAEHAVKLLSKP